MALTYKTRRRLSLVVLLIWLPAYIIGVMLVITALPRMPFWANWQCILLWDFYGWRRFVPFSEELASPTHKSFKTNKSRAKTPNIQVARIYSSRGI